DHRAIEHSVSTNHIWRERKETTRVNFRRNAKQHTNTLDYKHVNGKKNVKISCNNTKSGSSEYTVILSVMYHSNVSGRSSELRALLI
ncbi:hypothetical protein T09_15494, partial [Trichinella sp. T9]